MNNNSNSQPPANPAKPANPANQPKKNRSQLILLILLFVTPLVASYWFYFGAPDWMKPSIKHRGHLLAMPHLLPDMTLNDVLAKPIKLHNTSQLKAERKWSLVYYAGKQCGEPCKKTVLNLNQMYKLLGKEQERVLILLVLDDANAATNFVTELTKNAPHIQLRVVSPETLPAFTQFFGQADATKSAENKIYLLDPMNYWALWYEADRDTHDVHGDLKKLLKTSNFG